LLFLFSIYLFRLTDLEAECSKLPSVRNRPDSEEHDSAKTGGARTSFQPVDPKQEEISSLSQLVDP
jgi:hypothetical protein